MVPESKKIGPWLIGSIFIILSCLPMAGIASSFAAERPVIIAVVKSYDVTPYNSALGGFKKVLEERGIEVSLVEYDIKGIREEGFRVIQEVKKSKPMLVLTIGSLSTEVVRQEIKDIPVVFTMVLNPVASGFVMSMQSSGNNFTGASLDISFGDQFKNLQAVVPGIRNIGVIYNPQETETVVEEASKIAKGMGLELIKKPINAEKDIPAALKESASGMDALWSVADSTVFTLPSTQFILLYTLRNKLPFMGLSPSYVKAGALLALFCDNEDIGRQAGELAVKLLAGYNPAELPITIPRKTFLSLNLRTAEQIGIRISSEVINKAKEVYSE